MITLYGFGRVHQPAQLTEDTALHHVPRCECGAEMRDFACANVTAASVDVGAVNDVREAVANPAPDDLHAFPNCVMRGPAAMLHSP